MSRVKLLTWCAWRWGWWRDGAPLDRIKSCPLNTEPAKARLMKIVISDNTVDDNTAESAIIKSALCRLISIHHYDYCHLDTAQCAFKNWPQPNSSADRKIKVTAFILIIHSILKTTPLITQSRCKKKTLTPLIKKNNPNDVIRARIQPKQAQMHRLLIFDAYKHIISSQVHVDKKQIHRAKMQHERRREEVAAVSRGSSPVLCNIHTHGSGCSLSPSLPGSELQP